MKYLFIILVFLCSCGTAKFIVTEEEPTGVFDNCILKLKPISPKAEKQAKKFDGALVTCGDYKIGDTLIIDRNTFTNY